MQLNKPLILYTAIALVVVGIAFGAYFLFGGQNEELAGDDRFSGLTDEERQALIDRLTAPGSGGGANSLSPEEYERLLDQMSAKSVAPPLSPQERQRLLDQMSAE